MTRVYILLPVHNRREITNRFIRCLKAQSYPHYSLVLIDDGSTDGTEEMVRNEIEHLTVIKGKGKWWWAGALQQGYRWVLREGCDADDLVLIINDDTEFERDFLERGLGILRDRSHTLLLARRYSKSSGKLLDAGVHADWKRLRFEPPRGCEEINCLSTMGLFLRVRDFFQIGGFRPRLLPHFTSDYEFTVRAKRKGFTLMTDPSLRLWVDENSTWNQRHEEMSFLNLMADLFSKRSPVNPVTWTCFVALACPWRWKIQSWARIWGGAVVMVFSWTWRQILQGISKSEAKT